MMKQTDTAFLMTIKLLVQSVLILVFEWSCSLLFCKIFVPSSYCVLCLVQYEFKNRIQQMHARFFRRYCNLSSKTSTVFALGECGRMPLCVSYMTKCIKYWLKLLHMDRQRYPKQSYILLKRLDSAGRISSHYCVYIWFLDMHGYHKKLEILHILLNYFLKTD